MTPARRASHRPTGGDSGRRDDPPSAPLCRRTFLAAAALFPGSVLFTGTGCTSSAENRTPTVDTHSGRQALNHGYALFHGLLEKQRHVSKILWVKFESNRLETLIDDIATACDGAFERLEQLASGPPGIVFAETGLPEVETETREAIESTTTGELLGSSGRQFEAALLLTQIQALHYASHLARVLGDRDSATDRVEFLRTFETSSETLRRRALELLGSGPRFEIERT